MKIILYSTAVNDWSPEAVYRFRIPYTDARPCELCRMESIYLDYDQVYNITPKNNQFMVSPCTVVTVNGVQTPTGTNWKRVTLPIGKYAEDALASKVTELVKAALLGIGSGGSFNVLYFDESDTYIFFGSEKLIFNFDSGNLSQVFGFDAPIQALTNDTLESQFPLLWMRDNFNLIRIKEFAPEISLCYDGNSNALQESSFYVHREMDRSN